MKDYDTFKKRYDTLIELYEDLSSPPPQTFDWVDAVYELRTKMAELARFMLEAGDKDY